MPGTKEIRTKIKSVQNTRKITKAMEMVAASKMRKAQERMRHARPYGEKIRNVAAHISARQPGVPASVPGRARHGEARRHHRRHHRQGPVRRPQHQRAAPGAQPVQGMAGAGRGDRGLRDRQQGPRLHAAPGREHRLAGRRSSATGRSMEKLIGAVKVMLDGYIAGPLRPRC